MRNKIRNLAAFKEQLLVDTFKDVQSAFDAIFDRTIHKVTVIWNPPMNLAVPYFGGDSRLKSPDYVDCKRARNLTDSTVLACPGPTSFEWVGNGQVRVDAVNGLTVGHKYELVFEAVN